MPTNGTEDGAVRQHLNLVANSLLDRASLMQSLLGGSRDIDRDCNYPKGVIPKETYQELYDREPIAARVVEVYPKECWQVQPSVYEDEDSETETPFEKVWSELATSIRAENSYHQDEQGSVLWEYLYRADVLSGIGHYGIILLGIDDGKDLAEPADLVSGSISDEVTMAPEGTPWTPLPGTPEAGPVGESGPRLGKGSTDASAYTKGARTAGFANGKNRTWSWNQSGGNSKKGPKRRLTFLRVFPESMAWIDQFDSNPASPRFGQPVRYTLLFNDPAAQAAGVGLQMITAPVHWTRVIHVADNLASSEVFGVPRMQAVLNRLLDIRKIHGGSAEMYWRGAFPGYSLETLPQLGTEVDIDTEGVKKMMWDWANGLQRHVVLTGLTMKSLSPQVTDPSPQVNTQIEAICIKLGVPIRIFKGSERGELASSQDDAAWNDRLKQRQAGYVTPRLVVPFVDRLIALGVLPAPEGYSVWWPDLTSKSDQEKAAIASQRTTALVAYGASAPTQDIITPTDYLIKIQGFEEAEAQSIVENGEEAKAKREKEQAKQQADQLKQQQDQADAEHQRQLELAGAQGPQEPPPNEGGNGGGGTDGAPPVGPGGSPGGNNVADSGVQNYDPSQPREPAGTSGGGQFTKSGGSSTGAEGAYKPGKGVALSAVSDKFRENVLDNARRLRLNPTEVSRRVNEGVDKNYEQRSASPHLFWPVSHEDIARDHVAQVFEKMLGEKREKEVSDFKKLRDEVLAKPVPPPKELGPSTAQVQVLSRRSTGYVEAQVKQVLGKDATLQDVASLTGAPPDAVVTVTPGRTANSLTARVQHRDYVSRRTIYRDDDGKLVIHNDEFFMKPGAQGKGLGAEVFTRQVENAQRLGVDRLETHAAGRPYNGYYTWPRFGYDQPLSATILYGAHVTAIKEKFPAAESVGDLMLTPEGRSWWKERGTGMFNAVFDLKPGSRSLKVLHAYHAEKASKAETTYNVATHMHHQEEVDDIGNGQENFDYDQGTIDTLDSVWDKLHSGDTTRNYDPDQPRDDSGKWSGGGGSSPAGGRPAVPVVTREETNSAGRKVVFFHVAEDEKSRIRAFVTPEALRIKSTFVSDTRRGQGWGTALYGEAAKYAHSRGLRLESDEFVSPDAVRVWDGLARRGYEVTRHPATPDSEGGFNAVQDKGPVFSVPMGAATHNSGASHSREPAGSPRGGQFTKGADTTTSGKGGDAATPHLEAPKALAYSYIKENGSATAAELGHHLVDEGHAPDHGSAISLVHDLHAAGHLDRSVDALGLETYDVAHPTTDQTRPEGSREPLRNTAKAELTGGRWVTVDGVHVYVKGGKIVAGPAALEGHPPSDLKSIHEDAHTHSVRAETATHKAETGGSRTDHVEAMQHHADAAHSHTLAAQHPDNKAPEDSKVRAEAASVKATHHAVEAGHEDTVKHPERAQTLKTTEPQEVKAGAGDKSTQPATSPKEDYQKNGTRSTTFKKWFGDWQKDPASASKVVDPHTGEPKETHGEEPKVVYHGRGVEFSHFDPARAATTEAGLGFYFAENKKIADAFAKFRGQGDKEGNVLTAYLSIKNPFDFDKPISVAAAEKWAEAAKEVLPKFKAEAYGRNLQAYVRRNGNPDGTLPGHAAWHALAKTVGREEANRVLARVGHDGIAHTASDIGGAARTKSSQPDFGRVWVAFHPAQIKAKDNAGTFDESSANIYNEWMDYGNSREGSETMNDGTLGVLFSPGDLAAEGELDLGLVLNWDSNWQAVQVLMGRVQNERGASPEEIRRLGGILSSVDVTTLRPLPVTINVNGSQLVSLGVTTVLPPVIANYLAYSTARNPLATLRAARDLIRNTDAKVVGRRHSASELVAQELRPTTIFDPDLGPVLNVTGGEQAEMVSGLHDTLKEHGYSDWYIALLAAATEETGSLDAALPLASTVFNEQQEDPENEPQEDDASMALGLPFDLVHNFGLGYGTYLTTNAVAAPGAANPWGPYVGPRGGRGWKNANTGRIVYGSKQPGLGRSHVPVVPSTAGPAGAVPTTTAPAVVSGQPKAQRADPATVKAHIAKLLTNPSQITAAHIHDVKEQLLSMTVAQIHGVRKDLGLKASGLKADLAAKVSQRALAGLGKVQPQLQTPAPPQHQPPTPAQHPTPPVAPTQHQPPKLDIKDPVAVRAAVGAFISSKNWSGGAAGILQAYAHGSDTPLEKIGAHLASLTGVPHHVGFGLAHTAVKELAAGLSTHQPTIPIPPVPTPVHPAGTGTPSALHRGSNVITGAPAPAHLPTVPHKDEIEWSTGKPQPGTLNGVDFAQAPHHFWEHVKDKDIGEPPPTRPIQRAGVMVQEPDGRIWIVKPTNEFGDRKYTMPGGGVEHGLTHQQNAMKEVWEETGLQVEITGHLGDFRDSNNKNIGRLYIGKRVGGAPWDAKIEPHIIDDKTGKPAAESSEVVLVTPERARKLLHRSDDLAQLMTVAPIPLNTATRGRGSAPMEKFIEAIQPAAKAYKTDKKSKGESPGNAEMHAIQEIRGFNAKPTVVGKKDMDALVAKGDHIEVMRGVTGGYSSTMSATQAANKLTDEFRYGDHYPGYGIFGSGTYTDATKGYSNIASQYASGYRGAGGSGGAMMRMAIPKDAKIVKYSELEKTVPSAPPTFTDKGSTSTSDQEWRGMHAALAGYDAIHMDESGYGHNFYVILNRGVVTVQKEDATGHVIK